MRARGIVVVFVIAVASSIAGADPLTTPTTPTTPPSSTAPAPSSEVTATLPAHAVTALAGCWRGPNRERWTFRAHGDHGLQVVRELGETFNPSYAARARIPRELLFRPSTHTYGFATAGSIHAVLFLFELHATDLVAWSYWSEQPGQYAWSGNTYTIEPCARPS